MKGFGQALCAKLVAIFAATKFVDKIQLIDILDGLDFEDRRYLTSFQEMFGMEEYSRMLFHLLVEANKAHEYFEAGTARLQERIDRIARAAAKHAEDAAAFKAAMDRLNGKSKAEDPEVDLGLEEELRKVAREAKNHQAYRN